MKRIYIASPYTIGDTAINVKRQLTCVDDLMTLGFAPFAPLYSHFQHLVFPRPYTDWIAIDLVWVEACDCVLRLEGESSGADGEVKYALELGKPVFYSIEELKEYYKDEIFNNNIMKPTICTHPNLVPTQWNQIKPEPCEMIQQCNCGGNEICPVCNFGHGQKPCPCDISDHCSAKIAVAATLAQVLNTTGF